MAVARTGGARIVANTFLFYWMELFLLAFHGFHVFLFTIFFSAVRTALRIRFGHHALWGIAERLYYVGHTLGLALYTFILFRAFPPGFAAAWLVWLAARYFTRRNDLFYSVYVAVFFLASFGFVITMMNPPMTYFYGAPVVIFLFTRPDVPDNLHRASFRPIVLRAIFVLTISVIFIWFYLGRSGSGIDAVEKQPGVKYIFSFKRDHEYKHRLGEYLRFVQEDCEGGAYYFGGIEYLWFAIGHPNHILRYDKARGAISDTEWDIQSGFVPDMDCKNNRLYVGGYDPADIRVYQPGKWKKAVRIYDAPGGDIYNVKLLFDNTLMLVWDQSKKKRNLSMIRVSDGKLLVRHEVKQGVTFDIRSDLKECITCGKEVSLFSIHDRPPYIKLKKRFKAGLLYSCIYTTTPGRFIANDLGSHRVLVLDVPSEKIVGEKPLPHGARNMLLVRKGLVAVSDYWQGHIMFLDEDTLKVRGIVRTGRRARNLFFSRDKKKILYADGLGIGVLDMEKILDGRFRDVMKLEPVM